MLGVLYWGDFYGQGYVATDFFEFRASLLVVSSGPVAFSTFSGWPRAIFTEMSICATVEASGEAFCWFSFGEGIYVCFIITVTPTLI
jgi:hypothetical protein